MRWADAVLVRARDRERVALDPGSAKDERARLADAQRTLDERCMSPEDERRRAEIRAQVQAELERRQCAR